MHEIPDKADTGDGADWDALARYSAGESPSDEVARVEKWLATRPAERELVRLLSAPEAPLSRPVDVEAALMRTRSRLAEDAAPPQLQIVRGGLAARPQRPVTAATRSWRVRTLAAAAAIVVAVGYGGTAAWQAFRGADADAPQTFVTGTGARDSVTLADGTRVILGPASRLTVRADYATTRHVELEGAAFFAVEHDEAHPFTVRAGGVEIVDVGTVFTVGMNADGALAVAVTEGVVNMRRVRDSANVVNTTELRAGDRALMPAGDAPLELHRGTASEGDVAWTRGSLVYRDAPLAQVQADLERWYGVHLRVDGALAERTLTASFSTDSASQALRKLALALGAEVQAVGDTVVLRAAPRASSP